MKPKHWINLLVVGLAAVLITYFAYHWAVSTYADPTCRSYAESKGVTYLGFIPPDLSYDRGPSRMSRDGNCQIRTSNGKLQTYSLVAASGSGLGAPFLVSMALGWEVIFLWSFLGAALLLALIMRVISPRYIEK